MPKRNKTTNNPSNSADAKAQTLVWLRARYHLHTFSYRDPRSAFSSATAVPVPSPTAILLGICSTLYQLGLQDQADSFLRIVHECRVKVDAPEGVIFFRAFHQLKRYVTEQNKGKGIKPNVGFTEINQGTREYGVLQGQLDVYVGVPQQQRDAAATALTNRGHIGTHDSLCSLIGDVEKDVGEPVCVFYEPLDEFQVSIAKPRPAMIVTLSRFSSPEFGPEALPHWKMSGGDNTDLVPYVIPGKFIGTRNGKIYRKR